MNSCKSARIIDTHPYSQHSGQPYSQTAYQEISMQQSKTIKERKYFSYKCWMLELLWLLAMLLGMHLINYYVQQMTSLTILRKIG